MSWKERAEAEGSAERGEDLMISTPNQYIPCRPSAVYCNSYTTMTSTTILRPAILIVSDTASRDPSTDKSANALSAVLETQGPATWEQPTSKIVPDNVLDIQRAICDWTDGPDWFNLILISGGTGFAVRDNTPEVCRICLQCGLELTGDRLCRLSSIAMLLDLCKYL